MAYVEGARRLSCLTPGRVGIQNSEWDRPRASVSLYSLFIRDGLLVWSDLSTLNILLLCSDLSIRLESLIQLGDVDTKTCGFCMILDGEVILGARVN